MIWVGIILTGPGLAFRIGMHWLMCRFFKLAIFKPPTLRHGDILHEPSGFLVCVVEGVAPGVFQLAFGCIAVVTAVMSLRVDHQVAMVPLFLWVGLSLLIQGFPGVQDSRALWRGIKRRPGAKILIPILGPLIGVGLMRRRGGHYIAGIALAILVAALTYAG